MKLRPYQEQCINDLFGWLQRHPTGNPIVEATVGAGKSVIIAELCRRVITMSPAARIVMCVASRELCRQNLDKLLTVWADAPAGVCSASLGEKDLESQIIFATIGSIARHADKLGKVDIMLIDECHNVNSKDKGMYRTLIGDIKRFGNPSLCVIGFTGTPFRGDGIWLWQGEDPLFAGTACRITMDELLEQGYLAPLVVDKGDKPKMDISNVKMAGGDFFVKDLAHVAINDDLIKAVMDDFYISGFTTRNKFLFYCVNKEHAYKVLEALQSFMGLNPAIITADTPKGERDKTLSCYKLPKGDPDAINALVSIGTLTTGFDAPETDCIVLLRPTRSPVLYVQIAGRGMRIADGKKDCLWLDYTDTTEVLGAVNRIRGRNKSRSSSSTSAPVKYCDECGNANKVHATECAECGWIFPAHAPRTHGIVAGDNAPLAGYEPPIEQWMDVLDVSYHKHQKGDKPPTLRIDYDIGELYPVSEWKCFEHSGFALQKACEWWDSTIGGSVPFSVDDVIVALNQTSHKMPRKILCAKESGGRYWQIKDKAKFFDSVPGGLMQQVQAVTPPVITDNDLPF